jgi:hypothetical protein
MEFPRLLSARGRRIRLDKLRSTHGRSRAGAPSRPGKARHPGHGIRPRVSSGMPLLRLSGLCLTEPNTPAISISRRKEYSIPGTPAVSCSSIGLGLNPNTSRTTPNSANLCDRTEGDFQ